MRCSRNSRTTLGGVEKECVNRTADNDIEEAWKSLRLPHKPLSIAIGGIRGPRVSSVDTGRRGSVRLDDRYSSVLIQFDALRAMAEERMAIYRRYREGSWWRGWCAI